MAVKLYRNKTDKVQGIYDKNQNLIKVIPDGTVKMEEKEMGKYLRYFEEVSTTKGETKKESEGDKKAASTKKK